MTDVLPPATTAFLVVVRPDGSATATAELTAPEVSRPATLADMRRACYEVVADIAAAQAADTVMARLDPPKPSQAEVIRAKLEEHS